ncbi:MAG: uridine kinase [Anaerolineae bacterium]
MARPITIGVAGGSGSGKTTVSRAILRRVGPGRVAHLDQDSYYVDLSDIPLEERKKVNFDHPDAIETELFVEHLCQLQNNQAVWVPDYDFATYTRKPSKHLLEPRPVILVEGILILAEKHVRDYLDIKVFVDTDADLRFIRRLRRDTHERGRSTDSVIEQYLATVRPMHLEFVEPSKRYADIIIPNGGHNRVALDMIVARIGEISRAYLRERDEDATSNEQFS